MRLNLLIILFVTLVGFCSIASGQAEKSNLPLNQGTGDSINNKFIWIINEFIYSASDLNEALTYQPEVILRGWFKWNKSSDANSWKYLTQQTSDQNILFGGGGTCSALYPNEVDNEKFLRIVDRNPENQPEYFYNNPAGGFYHGDIQKKEYLDFIMGWVDNQIDAGVNTLFMDEVSGASSWRTGYSDNGMEEFRKYLKEKFITNRGWTVSDNKWRDSLDISLAQDCTDGTINTFDYRKYLHRKGYQNDPSIYNFPLKQVWGDPWNYMLSDSYIHRRNETAWKYLTDSIRHYSEKTGKSVFIAANGWNHLVDYQIEGVWYRWKVDGGKLSITDSYVDQWRTVINNSEQTLKKTVPLIIFNDWGSTMPFFDEIGEEDQILWFRVYGAEIFASGAILAWPVSNWGGSRKPSANLESIMKSLISWYKGNKNLYLNTKWVNPIEVDLKGQPLMVSTLHEINNDTEHKKIVHLINKQLGPDRQLVVRNNFTVNVSSSEKPESVWAVSPDFSNIQKLNFTWENNSVDISVNSLEAYTLVVIDFKNKMPQTISFNEIAPHTYGDANFSISASASSDLPVNFSSSNSNIASVADGIIQIKGAGNCDITASQAGNSDFDSASEVTHTLVINKAVLTVTAVDTSRTTGKPNPSFRLTYSGFVGSDNLSSLFVKPTASCSANLQSPSGFYDINVSGGMADNYTFIYKKGKLHVTAASGINENLESEIIFYPNPCNQFLEFNNLPNKPIQIKIFDIFGKMRISKQLEENVMDVSLLPAGVYILRVDNNLYQLLKK